MNHKWDSDNYTDNFRFVNKYGEELINFITAKKGSFVVDLGCGNGAITQILKDKGFNTLGIDSSPEMIKKARELHPSLNFILADACEFKLDKKADVIFSNAVFHWIDNHDMLAQNISKNLATGGELIFEFGGKGNADIVHSALDEAFMSRGLTYERNFNFCSIGEFAPVLERYGFKIVYAVLFDRLTEQNGENGLADWINMFIKSAFADVDLSVKQSIINQVEKICRPKLYIDGKWYVDYVRIRMKAIKI